jgi:carotenoid 1,2-hydratase
MTERGRDAVKREASRLTIGPSALNWENGVLTISIDEIAAPFPARVAGVIRVYPRFLNARDFCLDAPGRHFWRPIAPAARVEVEMSSPAASWRGAGYLDSNWGAGPLEESFSQWNWSRAALGDGAAIFYDVARRSGDTVNLSVLFDASGAAHDFGAPPCVALPPTFWRIARTTRSEPTSRGAVEAGVLRTLEDAPFYARSLVSTQLFGERAISIHESLSLERFGKNWVKTLLPFKMPRALPRIRRT